MLVDANDQGQSGQRKDHVQEDRQWLGPEYWEDGQYSDQRGQADGGRRRPLAFGDADGQQGNQTQPHPDCERDSDRAAVEEATPRINPAVDSATGRRKPELAGELSFSDGAGSGAGFGMTVRSFDAG